MKTISINIRSNIPKNIITSDLIIVSTTSIERFGICKYLQEIGYLGKLLLEKFLFPDLDTLIESKKLFKKYPSKIYVNQWMRKTHLKEILKIENASSIEIIGNNLGILCNSVHFIDLISEIIDLKNLKIDLENSYIKKIINSKRPRYKEIIGKLNWIDTKKNIIFSLEDKALDKNNHDIFFNIYSQDTISEYIYTDDYIKDKNSSKNYHIPYLSEHAKSTIYNILFDIDAVIPTYKKSYFHHFIVFDTLAKILNNEDFNSIKIT